MSELETKLEELQRIYNEAQEIYQSELSWETKYHMILSDDISVRVKELANISPNYPDTSYASDVREFMDEFSRAMKGNDKS